MKNLFLSLLLVASCAAPAAPVMLPTEGPLMRQVTRVVERHNTYVTADMLLSESVREMQISDAQSVVQLMLSMPQVPADLLAPRLSPVLDRHDSYVDADFALEPLMRDTYLASSSGLRSLLSQARWSR